jgi:cytochrome P450
MPGDQPSIRTASVRDTVAVLLEVVLPVLAKGPIIRRPFFVGLSERLRLDARAITRMQRLRSKYGPGPVLMRTPLRRQAIVLSDADVERILEGADEPFSPSTAEKRMALPHFEPNVALISTGIERIDRRRFNEQVLQTDRPLHPHAARFVSVIREEADELMGRVRAAGGSLDWEAFETTWFRVVRRIVLGDGARDDEELTEVLEQLRNDANVGPVIPRRKGLKERYDRLLGAHLDRAEPGSLAEMVRAVPTTSMTEPADQVSQWLFAYDPAGMTTFRSLALLATHPDHARRAYHEIREASDGGTPHELPFLRAVVLESLRLWPTTPMILRETTTETTWESGVLPADSTLLIFAPLFHRDEREIAYAHRFAPEVWQDGRKSPVWPLVPFSGGPAVCPGQDLVLLTTSTTLAALIDGRRVRMERPERVDPARPMPAILDNYTLRFIVED